MMQAEGHESTVERIGFERQSIGSSGAEIISRNEIFVPVADVEHGQSLIDADDAAAFKSFGNRPRYSAGTGCYVQDYFVPFQRQHVRQFFCQLSADLRNAAVKVGCMLRVMKARLVIVPVSMLVTVLMLIFVRMAMFVVMGMRMAVLVRVFVAAVLMAVAMFIFVRMAVFMAMGFMTVLMMAMAGIMSMAVCIVLMIMVMFVIMFVFVFHFGIHLILVIHFCLQTILYDPFASRRVVALPSSHQTSPH